ncbi:hypothetical protein VPH35_005089 [Triticum aestivum]
MSSVARRAPSCWSSIPTELAGVVLRRLPCHADRVRFAAVCKQWRASARQTSPPPHYPWLPLPDRTFYSLAGSAFRPLPLHLDRHRQLPHAQSSCGERFDGAYTLVSPFFMSTTILLPGLSNACAPNVPLLVANDQPVPNMLKLVVCSHRPTTSSPRSLMNNEAWTHCLILSCEGKLLALDSRDGLFSVSIGTDRRTSNPTVSRVEHLMGSSRGVLDDSPRYLLLPPTRRSRECWRDSAVVLWNGLELQMKTKFKVFEADLARSRWASLRSVGDDRLLFVGPWCSRAVHVTAAGEQDRLHRDRIFFTEDDRFFFLAEIFGNRSKTGPSFFYCNVYDMRLRRSQFLLETPVRPLKCFPWLFSPSQR